MDRAAILSMLRKADEASDLPRLGGMARADGVVIASERFWAFARRDGVARRRVGRACSALALLSALRDELRRTRGAGLGGRRAALAACRRRLHAFRRHARLAGADDGTLAARPDLALPGRAGLSPPGARAAAVDDPRAVGRGDAGRSQRRRLRVAPRTGINKPKRAFKGSGLLPIRIVHGRPCVSRALRQAASRAAPLARRLRPAPW